jgi:hypothetical protein
MKNALFASLLRFWVPAMRRSPLALTCVLVLAASLSAKDRSAIHDPARAFNSVIPLGVFRFDTTGDSRAMFLMATAENHEFKEWRVSDYRRMPFDGHGKSIKYFPSHIDFRVTATAHPTQLVGIDQFPLQISTTTLNDYMTKLRFRVRIFRGLDTRTVDPEGVTAIGMPLDVPYDERVYRVGFDIGKKVPVDDRIVLEVLSPEGDRIAKFHLEF